MSINLLHKLTEAGVSTSGVVLFALVQKVLHQLLGTCLILNRGTNQTKKWGKFAMGHKNLPCERLS